MPKLTEKQRRFADYYIQTGNASESARKAGYSARTAHRTGQENLQKPAIKAYIDKQLKKIADERIMDAREALELLTSIARGEMTEEIYIPTEEGVKRFDKTPDIKDRQKALESLLKRYPINREEELKEKLLEARIEKIKAETKNEETGENRVLIVNDKEAMKKELMRRANSRKDG